MTPERWRLVDRVLQEALQRYGGDRTEFLAQACGGDPALRAEVEAFLAVDGAAEQSIGDAVRHSIAAFQEDRLGFAPGDRIGVYRVIRELGRGGMGTVYLSERDDGQFQQQVAIKLVTRGMDTAELLRRFRHERQILASLDHPNIARLLDGGSTADGRPFLVMEYVQGKTITAYCSEHRLSARRRIELFRKVCAAVESAHQNLVVHRDLKPGNILVDVDGTPKLLDFGIAKMLGPDGSDSMTLTAGGMQMLTPDYASPEQVRGEGITTAADLYSLGTILYELLTGVRAHRLTTPTPAAIAQAVCEEEIVPPSEAARATSEAAVSADELAGDVDNILLTALRKDRHERYGSVQQFSEDLRRFLEELIQTHSNAGLRVKSTIKAGALSANHSVAGLRLKSTWKATRVLPA